MTRGMLLRHRAAAGVAVNLGVAVAAYLAAFALRFDLEIPRPHVPLVLGTLPLLLACKLAGFWSFDVLLGPTTPTTAFELGAKTADPLAMYLSDVCTIPSNLAGHPAISVPFGVGDDGLPVGVQVLAPAIGETVMFQVAARLEQAATGAARQRSSA